MNREIKFRGKMLDSDDFVYGYYIHSELPNEIFEHKIYCADVNRLIDVKAETIGQFTGLHDKNGKEIYEGDAFEDEDGYYIIVWDEKEAGFLVDTYGIEEWFGEGGQECYGNKIEFIGREPIDYFDFSKIEITKNIYDNPELLGGE